MKRRNFLKGLAVTPTIAVIGLPEAKPVEDRPQYYFNKIAIPPATEIMKGDTFTIQDVKGEWVAQ